MVFLGVLKSEERKRGRIIDPKNPVSFFLCVSLSLEFRVTNKTLNTRHALKT